MPTNLRIDHMMKNYCDCEEDCGGDCWDQAISVWKEYTLDWFNKSTSNVFQIAGLPLWDKKVTFTARIPYRDVSIGSQQMQLLRAMTMNTSWDLRYYIDTEDDVLWGLLSHHDSPCGGWVCVSRIEDEEK